MNLFFSWLKYFILSTFQLISRIYIFFYFGNSEQKQESLSKSKRCYLKWNASGRWRSPAPLFLNGSLVTLRWHTIILGEKFYISFSSICFFKKLTINLANFFFGFFQFFQIKINNANFQENFQLKKTDKTDKTTMENWCCWEIFHLIWSTLTIILAKIEIFHHFWWDSFHRLLVGLTQNSWIIESTNGFSAPFQIEVRKLDDMIACIILM